MAPTTVAVLIERGQKKCFARALDWPGWSRSGRDEPMALESLEHYAERYALVAAKARAGFPKTFEFDVSERTKGDASTEFGIPGAQCAADRVPLVGTELARWVRLLEASWATLDQVAAVSSEELRKGPRGGGRDRSKMLAHVFESEPNYARQIGLRLKPFAFDDAVAIAAERSAIVDALRTVEEPKWPLRYWIHRSVWHVLDHAWGMKDRQP